MTPERLAAFVVGTGEVDTEPVPCTGWWSGDHTNAALEHLLDHLVEDLVVLDCEDGP